MHAGLEVLAYSGAAVFVCLFGVVTYVTMAAYVGDASSMIATANHSAFHECAVNATMGSKEMRRAYDETCPDIRALADTSRWTLAVRNMVRDCFMFVAYLVYTIVNSNAAIAVMFGGGAMVAFMIFSDRAKKKKKNRALDDGFKPLGVV